MGRKTTTTCSSKGGKKASMKAKILSALASQKSLGKATVPKSMIVKLCAVTNHHTFDTTCSALKSKGLIEYGGGKGSVEMNLTDAGYAEVGPDAPAPVTNNEEAQETLRDGLSTGKTKQMFDFLAKEGRGYTRAEIAAHVGMDENAKTFKTYISYLSKIVEKVEGGKVRLNDDAFPFDRPCDQN